MAGTRGKRRETSHSYQDLRARNNVAVRKSREKARHRNIELEKKLKEQRENNRKLKDRLGMKWKELSLLKCLLVRVHIEPPQKLTKALAMKNKHLSLFENLEPEHHQSKCICEKASSDDAFVRVQLNDKDMKQEIVSSVVKRTSRQNLTGKNLKPTRLSLVSPICEKVTRRSINNQNSNLKR